MKDKVLVTGANGNLGKKFILSKGDLDVCALAKIHAETVFCKLYSLKIIRVK